ncbi:MAG: metalloregulator ArsR/SmtB family transcription factor [Planctomycetota bacterium]
MDSQKRQQAPSPRQVGTPKTTRKGLAPVALVFIVNHMVDYAISLSATFAALSDPTRRTILNRLAKGTTMVTELAKPFEMSLAAVSKHLKVLERAGLIVRSKVGREHHIQIEAKPLAEAQNWIATYAKFWEQQFDNLDLFLKQTAPKSTSPPGHGKK